MIVLLQEKGVRLLGSSAAESKIRVLSRCVGVYYRDSLITYQGSIMLITGVKSSIVPG